jgi:asparagine synthase (glutamine-hydrolysing)
MPPRAFWRIQDAYQSDTRPPMAAGELRDVLIDSIRHHLVADVPVGLFLSAGIDSTVIAALAAQIGTKLQTVTLAFKEYAGTANDEAPLAEATAQRLQTEHVTVRIDREEFESVLEDFFYSMDQPSIDGLNSYLISRAVARQGLKVALSGLGGDELFGGYPSFQQIPVLLSWARMIPSRGAVSRALRRVLAALPPAVIPPKVAGLLSHSADVGGAFVLRRAFHLEEELSTLLDESWLNEGLQRLSTNYAIAESLEHLSTVTAHAQISALESSWYMRNQLLRDVDWASMAHSVEVRVPFVDVMLFKRLAPLIASSAPPSKQDLAACAYPPLCIDTGQPKKGFTTPVRDWVSKNGSNSPLGLRGWAVEVHRRFRTLQPGGFAKAA